MANQISPLDEAKQNLVRMDGEFKAALPSHITPEKFRNVAITALQNNQDLLQCKRQTLWNSIIKCAQDGLLPDGREAALVKFKDEVVYLPMVQGILKKVRNSGELSTIDAQIVFENDRYESWVDEKGQHFSHRKAMTDRGKPVLTYAYALTKDGAVYFEEISEDDMHKISEVARTQQIWSGSFRNEMKRKSAIHRLSKRLPMSTDLMGVIDRDNEFYDLDPATPANKATTSSKLSEAVSPAQEPIIDTTCTPSAPEPEIKPTACPTDAVQTVIYEVSYQSSKEGSPKTWRKIGLKIGDQWYDSFDTNIMEKIEEAKKSKTLVNIHFKENPPKNGKVYFTITDVTYPTVDEVRWPEEKPTNQSPI